MTFGEKSEKFKKEQRTQPNPISRCCRCLPSTVRGWEIEGRYPKKHDLYQKLADILSCDISYLMTEEEAFYHRSI